MAITQELFYGGSLAGNMSGDVTLKPGYEKIRRVNILDPNGANRIITMADATKISTGGPVLYMFNNDSAGLYTITFNDAGANLIGVLQPNKAGILMLADNSTLAGLWHLVAFTADFEPYGGP